MASQYVKVSGRGAQNVKVSQSNKDGKLSQRLSFSANTVSGGRAGHAGTRRPSAPRVVRVRKPNGPRKA